MASIKTNSELTLRSLESHYARQVPYQWRFYQDRAYTHRTVPSAQAYNQARGEGWPTQRVKPVNRRTQWTEKVWHHDEGGDRRRGPISSQTAYGAKLEPMADIALRDPLRDELARHAKKARHAVYVASLSALPPSFTKRSAYELEAEEFKDEDQTSLQKNPFRYYRHSHITGDFFSDLEESGRFTSENGKHSAQSYYKLTRPLQGRLHAWHPSEPVSGKYGVFPDRYLK